MPVFNFCEPARGLLLTDTLTHFSIQNETYERVFRFQADTTLFSPDSVCLKTLYFAPRKGLVKIDFTQNHFFERIN